MAFEKILTFTKEKYPKIPARCFTYGTAGFRMKASDLDTVLFRMGILAVLRSKATKANIGLMVTASHNPECDNGVKLVDPMGEMMVQEWEKFATDLANAEDNNLVNTIQEIMTNAGISSNEGNGRVVIGRDTRSSSDRLHGCAVDGVVAAGGSVVECGVVPTPLLHYRVCTANDGGSYGEPTNEGYSNKIIEAFLKLQEGAADPSSQYNPSVLFDGANGVGGLQMAAMMPHIQSALQLQLYNDGSGSGVLNSGCGADYVKTGQCWPQGVPQSPNTRCVSVDGDADRVVYSYLDNEGKFHLMDGDKIATLIAGYLRQQLSKANISLNLGLVQTAYANGASTRYINGSLGVPVSCAKTGVKHLHHMALDYDIGVYFEANGHGTIIFSDKAKETIRKVSEKGDAVASRLLTLIDVINETVGDAISDMLLVEVILREKGWSMQQWDKQYQDLPNKLFKVRVKDRTVIQTADAERCCTAPAGLQDAINALLGSDTYKDAQPRSFIRPSGTEDVVRVYAEASTAELANKLGVEVSRLVFDLAAGEGERP